MFSISLLNLPTKYFLHWAVYALCSINVCILEFFSLLAFLFPLSVSLMHSFFLSLSLSLSLFFHFSSRLLPSQCEDNMLLQDSTRYLKLPFSKGNLPGNNQAVKGSKESFWITSFLCSTKLTQNGTDQPRPSGLGPGPFT